MQTDKLIGLLVTDLSQPARPFIRSVLGILALGLAAGVVLFLLTLGPRSDIAGAAETWRFDFKLVQVALLSAAAFLLFARLARPGAPARHGYAALVGTAALMAAAIGIELFLLPSSRWADEMIGTNAVLCLTAIPFLSVPLLAAALIALRHGAPTRPVLAGTAAGLLAGAIAALLYALHCDDDSPLFVALWYSIAIAIVAVCGALLGRYLLRW